MSKIIFLISTFVLITGVQAQIFFDNFESYPPGSYIGPQSNFWRTFGSFGEGSAEDVTVNNITSSSSTQSIYFWSSSVNGGPQDVILDFGNTYNSGIFTFESDFHVTNGKTAYFNLHATDIIGGLLALEVYCENGLLTIQSGAETYILTSYPQSTWFTLTIECNLSTHIWQAKINNQSIGSWVNAINSVHYLNIYPKQNAKFYMDDVSFDHVPYFASNLNASIANLNMGGTIASQVVTPSVVIMNTGATPITSFDLNFSYNGLPNNQTLTGLNLSPAAAHKVSLPNLTLLPGSILAEATISNINGASDDVLSDNYAQLFVNPLVPANGKMVVGEKGTGTWCEWCPRGAVFMDRFEKDFDNFWLGIAVHNSDPMTVANYNSGLAITGFPNVKIDRIGTGIDPSAMTTPFYTRLQTVPTAQIEVGANYNPTTRVLNISGEFDFLAAANNGYKAAFVITEDGVTGGVGYAQANAYSGGGNGVMGGYELLPSPVPASQMVYDHVARAIQPSFDGFAGSFPSVVASGSTHTVNLLMTLPTTWDADSLHLIVLLIDPDGYIDNAGKATMAEALTNGFVQGTDATSSLSELAQIDATFGMFPNPASTNVSMTFNLKNESDVSVRVLDMAGKVLANKDYASMNGASSINYNTSELKQGIYTVEVTINGERITRRLVIQ